MEIESSKPGSKIRNHLPQIHTYLSTPGRTIKARDTITGQEATIKSTPNGAPTIELIIDGIATEQVLNQRHFNFEIETDVLNTPSSPKVETIQRPTADDAKAHLAERLQSALSGIAAATRIEGLLALSADKLPELMAIVDTIAIDMAEPGRVMTIKHSGPNRLAIEFNPQRKERYISESSVNSGLKTLCSNAGKRTSNTLHELYPSEHARQITERLITKLIEAKPSKELRIFQGAIYDIRATIFKVSFHCYQSTSQVPKFTCDISISKHQF